LITLPDHTDIYYQVVKRQDGRVDHLKYKALRINVIIDNKSKQYYEGQDFSLTETGSLQWKPNKGPFSGQLYSIHYEMELQYRATEALHVNRFAQGKGDPGKIKMVKMNEQWTLEREYLAERKDSEGNELVNKIRDADDD